jgi:nucleotide-binding universal stress UspA family protein
MAEQVVVGVDGTAESLAAGEWAGAEAARRGLAVRLLNVWQAPVSNVQLSPAPEALRLWQASRVHEAAASLAQTYPGLDVTADQVSGTPMKVLLRAAEEGELIVLGSRGLSGVAGFLYGSVGMHVLSHSRVPVVMVRALPDPADRVGGDVVLCVDLDRPADSLVAFAFEAAATRQAPLRPVHVWNPYRMYGYSGVPLDARLEAQLRGERERQLGALLAPWTRRYPDVKVTAGVVSGSVARTLVEAAGAGTALVVVGRRVRRATGLVHIGPVTHGLLHHASSPVAVVAHT